MNIDKQALREAAEKATKGNYVVGHNNINQRGHLISVFVCQEWRGEAGGVVAECHVNCLTETSEQVYANAEFIAVANPATMLALLDENLQLQREKDAIEAVALALRDDMRQAREQLAAAEKRNAELERSETQLIDERDNAESALNDAYKAVMGQAPEWSNWFSFENAIDEIELACELWRNQTDDVIQFRQRIAELEARAVNLPKRSVDEVMLLSGFSRDYAEGWCAGNDNAIHEIRAAGIKVKGA
ncbi:ead/Ea22-like family protein [Salmonella enterica subsp. enterica]|nr:ead/Ea22-like family protein [Salmonella enterica subsp. enterica serovar Sandiego]